VELVYNKFHYNKPVFRFAFLSFYSGREREEGKVFPFSSIKKFSDERQVS